MGTGRIDDLRAFKEFIEVKLANGGAGLSPEEALYEWEIENQSAEAREEICRAIQRGFDDVAAGRVRPAREAVNELRQKYNLPPLA